MGTDFTPDQKRYLEGFVSGMQAVRGPRAQPPIATAAAPMGPDAAHIAAQDATTGAGKKLVDQEKWKRAEHPFDAYPRLKAQAKDGRLPQAGGQFPLALFRPFLCRPGAGELYGAPADSQWHPESLAVGGDGRRRDALRRRLRSCDDTRQPADPRDQARRRGPGRRGGAGPRPLLARIGRRQYPQRHGLGDGGDRPPGALRHAPARARMALPHPERSLALWPAAQVQRGLRRRRADPDAGGDQRHRLPGGEGEVGTGRRGGRQVPPAARRDHRPSRHRARHRRVLRARGVLRDRRRHRARLHRPWRPHRSHQGPHEICSRRLGLREISRRRRGKARTAADALCPKRRSSRARPSTAPRISACIRSARRASTGSA